MGDGPLEPKNQTMTETIDGTFLLRFAPMSAKKLLRVALDAAEESRPLDMQDMYVVALDHVEGWEGILDGDQQPIPFSRMTFLNAVQDNPEFALSVSDKLTQYITETALGYFA